MDIEKMIERLEAWNEQHLSVVCGNGHFACDYLCENEDCIVVRAATALSTLYAKYKSRDSLVDRLEDDVARLLEENERIKEELKKHEVR